MDIHIIFWGNDSADFVKTLYLNSEFLGRGTAEVLIDHFMNATECYDGKEMLQVIYRLIYQT